MAESIKGGSSSSPAEKAKKDASKLANEGKQKVAEAAETARQKGDAALTGAGEELESLTSAIDAAAEQLSEEDKEGLAAYAHQLSGGISSLGNALQEKSVDDLAADVKKLARENPTGYLLGSIALGFTLSRFAKASGPSSTDSSRSTTTPSRVDPTTTRSPSSTGVSATSTNSPSITPSTTRKI